jgi:hypothetical protein
MGDPPEFHGRVAVYNSAVVKFYAPSDLSGVGGMRRECIRAVPSWNTVRAHHDMTAYLLVQTQRLKACVVLTLDALDSFLKLSSMG